MAHAALKTWELENAVKLVDSARDQIYNYSTAKAQAENDAHPWRTDPHHFKTILISAVALLKMVMHARSGGALEVMGLMQGYVDGPNIVVTDAFRLPVEGTETRVNAQDEANEYMVNFLTRAREVGQLENAVGWYHSHPGYGCWLSGIDVDTEMNQQRWNDPFCAVVIDPDRTISAGKVEIGAFRTFPDGHKPSADDGDVAGQEAADAEGFQTIPLAKIDDFGAHAARYYSMEVAHFKSSLDSRLLESLWNKYWVSTLSSSPLFTNRDYGTKQMAELALKIKQAEGKAKSQSRAGGQLGALGKEAKRTREEFEKIIKAGNKIAAEEQSGLAAAQIKEKLFCDLVGTAGLEGAAQAGAALPQEAVMAQR